MKNDIINLLKDQYIKILRIYPEEDKYIFEKVDDTPRIKNSLSLYVSDFVNNGNIYPDDIPSFLNFFNSLEIGNTYCYRRKLYNHWSWVLMEIKQAKNGDIIMLIREISNDLLDLVAARREIDKSC